MDSVLRFGGGVYGSALFVAVDGDGFQVELNALTGAWEIHFVFVLHASVCKVAAATDDLAPGEELIHDSGANSGGAFVRKDESVALFDTQSAIPGLSLNSGQFKLPVLYYPLFHNFVSFDRISGAAAEPLLFPYESNQTNYQNTKAEYDCERKDNQKHHQKDPYCFVWYSAYSVP